MDARILACLRNLVDLIKLKEEEIIHTLIKYESYETAKDEFRRSIKCLENINEEKNLVYKRVHFISTFFPLNLPLYSLTLFGIVPSFTAEKVFIRPPILMRDIIREIKNILKIEEFFPEISFIEKERKFFIDAYASVSDVVIFIGRHKNSKVVQRNCNISSLFIYNGAGINPILITKSANLDLAVSKTIEMRLFNSGQDCAGPDAILVFSAVIKEFLKKLFHELGKVKCGNLSNKENTVGRLIDFKHTLFIKRLLNDFKEKIIYGGNVNLEKSIVYPTVILDEIKRKIKYFEFFAPIFYILPFRNNQDLDSYFLDRRYKDNAMYASVFGNSNYKNIPRSVILKNKIVNDIEEGNKPYGGYGRKANYISFYGKYFYRPLLISKEISEYLKFKNSLKVQIGHEKRFVSEKDN